MTGAIVLMISYGYQIQEHDDPMIKIAELVTQQAAEVAQPGTFLVDVFPFRKCLLLSPMLSSSLQHELD